MFDGSLEYFIGDGVHKYSELMKYAAAPASTENDPNTLVLRDENGKIDSGSIDFPTVPDATSTVKGIVKASTTTAADNAVKSDANGTLDGWKDAIIDSITADDGSGGLSANPVTGELEVDFDAMYTHNRDKFEALLKSLKMQIPLEEPLNLYVNKNSANASDTIEDGRGTQDKPFKTIQAAVNFATQTYAFGAYNGNIYIATATYEESVRLPQYTSTSGVIILRALDEANPPTIATSSTSNYATPVSISGGTWYLRRLNISAVWSDPGTDTLIHTSSVVSVTGGNTVCDIKGCTLSGAFTGNTPTGWANPRVINVQNGAVVDINVMQGYQNSFTFSKGDDADHHANASWIFMADSNSLVRFRSANTENDVGSLVDMYEIPCSGTVHTFASAINNSRIAIYSGGKYYPYFTGTMTGTKYTVSNYSRIEAPYGGFPGDTDGTPGVSDNYIDMDTFARYSERNTPNNYS